MVLINKRQYLTDNCHSYLLNWWKGKPSGSIACTRKQQPRFYWSCSSVVMNDATPLTPPSAWAELHFQMSTTYMYTPWSLRTRKIWLHNDVVRGDFLQPTKQALNLSKPILLSIGILEIHTPKRLAIVRRILNLCSPLPTTIHDYRDDLRRRNGTM